MVGRIKSMKNAKVLTCEECRGGAPVPQPGEGARKRPLESQEGLLPANPTSKVWLLMARQCLAQIRVLNEVCQGPSLYE